MEKLKQYITRKRCLYLSFADGILGVLMLAIYFIAMSSGNYQSILSMISVLCTLFYINFVLLLLVVLCHAFVIFYLKQKNMTLYILGGCSVAALLMALLSFSAVRAIQQLLSGNFSAIWSLAYSGANADVWLILMILLQLVIGVMAGYLCFIKKGEELSQEDLSQMQATAKQAGDAAATAAKKAAEEMAQGTAKLSQKWRTYAKSEKGKKNIKIFGVIAAIVFVIIIAVSIWSATRTTPIDLTSSCEVTFDGYNGEGSAYVSCDVDYDINNPEIASFVYDVDYVVENDGALSNGDTTTITANYSEETARSLKLKVENAQREVEVEGLTEVYRSFADIPVEISQQFEQSTKDALNEKIMEAEGNVFGPEKITINSMDMIAVYYEYSEYFGEGSAYYIYRVNVSEEDEYKTEQNTDYYSVRISPISSEYTLDLSSTSNDLNITEIYSYEDEKTDAKAIENFSRYYSDLQTVKENLSDEVYKDSRIEKNNS